MIDFAVIVGLVVATGMFAYIMAMKNFPSFWASVIGTFSFILYAGCFIVMTIMAFRANLWAVSVFLGLISLFFCLMLLGEASGLIQDLWKSYRFERNTKREKVEEQAANEYFEHLSAEEQGHIIALAKAWRQTPYPFGDRSLAILYVQRVIVSKRKSV